jgi:hypothetical protein
MFEKIFEERCSMSVELYEGAVFSGSWLSSSGIVGFLTGNFNHYLCLPHRGSHSGSECISM